VPPGEADQLKEDEMSKYSDKELSEICGNCGFTFGSHYGGDTPYPRSCCPGTDGAGDWENGPGTVFKSTGEYKAEGVENGE